MSVYCLVENNKITRYNVTLPFSSPAFSVNTNAKNVEELGLYPVTGQEPAYDPIRQRLSGPTYKIVGKTVERTWTIEQIPDEEKAGQVRAERNNLLNGSDWSQVLDAPVDRTKWANYRQALRDLPSQAGFPWNVTWPTKP